MTLNIVRCKHCKSAFQSDVDECPHCCRKSPIGHRNLLLKWISVFVSFAVLVSIVLAFARPRGF